jgi:hypothetical protein
MTVAGTRKSWRSLLLLCLLVLPCVGATCLGPVRGTLALRDAQDTFNQAAVLTNQRYAEPFVTNSADMVPPESPRDKYARVVQIINEDVLNSVDRNDLKVNALALLAFSEWQLKHYDKANVAAETGKDLYERTGLQTNRRDYGMLIILRGLVKHSQAYERYQKSKKENPLLEPQEAQSITELMGEAIKNVDEINAKLDKDEPVVIYANRQQLLIIKNMLDVWSATKSSENFKQPMCLWANLGAKLGSDSFPREYAIKDEVTKVQNEISKVGKNLGCS